MALLLPNCAEGDVIINEIHYDPDLETEQVEFIELYNRGTNAVDLSGWSFTSGVDYTFSNGVSVAGGGYVVVAEDPAEFQAKFGFAALGPWVGKLENFGEEITLRNRLGQVEDRVDYQLGFPWPIVGDPPGFSIELVNPAFDNDLGGSWRPSVAAAGLELVPWGSAWKYFLGTQEASSPATAWRQVGFNDSAWQAGNGPIGYGEPDVTTPLPTSQSANYHSVYLRKIFSVADLSGIARLDLQVVVDDGAVAWINGVEVGRANVPAGELAYDRDASTAGERITLSLNLTNVTSLLVPGNNVLAVHVFNSGLNSSDILFDAGLFGRPTAGGGSGPSPGFPNTVYATNIPPQLRQVEHTPREPKSGEAVKITAKATDPEGVASMVLEYQSVDPGSYIELTDTAYTNASNWVSLPMNDSGVSGDETAGDDVYTVQLPTNLQVHRRLIRYRIRAADRAGFSVRVPYAEDPQPNFAYFVYDGVPAWQGSIQPGVQPVLTFPASEMGRLPAYHLISKRSEVEDCTWFSRYGGDAYQWTGTLVYDGEVYDHIHFRTRGGVWRYSMVKNMWKFLFNRGHYFQARDDWGNPFKNPWRRLNLGASIQQGDFNHRGEQGMFESLGFRLFNLAGLEAPHTAFVTLRIIDEAQESFANNQFEGDFWGVYLTTEQVDGRFLDEHGLPDGNLYKMEDGTGPGNGELKNQGPDQASDSSDLISFRNTVGTSPSDQWWRDNLDLDRYYNYYTIVQAIHHYDICCGKNYYYFFNPVTGKMQVHPWDLDLTWADNMYEANDGGTDRDIFDSGRIFTRPAFNLELKNRVREILDLLYNEDQTWRLIDEYAGLLRGPNVGPTILDADRAMWDYNPKMNDSRYTPNLGKAGQGRFYQFPGESATNASLRGSFDATVQLMKFYVARRSRATTYPSGTALAAWESDNQIPATPVVAYTGPGGFPLNELTFRVANYSGTHPFAALKWRIGEITPPGAPAYDPARPNKYEIESVWESAEITNASSLDIQIPPEAVRADSTYRVRCRFKDTTGRWSHWSPPVEFTSGQPFSAPLLLAYLRITEVMYNSAAGSDFDFVELRNTSAETTLKLAGAKFTQGIDYLFPPRTEMPPGGYLLVTRHPDPSLFRAYYGLSTNVALVGPYTGNLANEGELLTLRTSAGGTDIATFTYKDSRGWPLPADGTGHSLIPLVWAEQADGALNYGGNWRPSTHLKGSPGRADPAPLDAIVLNEITAHTDFAAPPPLDSNDWIELYNRAAADFTFGPGWYLSDDGNPTNLTRWMIPPGTVIRAGGFVTFDEQTGFHNPPTTGFGLNKAGEQVYLSHLPGTAEDRVVDSVAFKGQENDWSLGRVPDGGPYWDSLTPRTRDTANAAPAPRVVITEIMYHPPDVDGQDNVPDEFIEIFNPTPGAVAFYDTNGTWRLDGGVQFVFPSNVVLAPLSYLLVVSFDPNNAALATAFRNTYGITSPSLRLFGPYAGKLANSSERVALEKPQAPDLPGDSVSWVIMDEVIYGDRLPWPAGADGIGPSLQRLDLTGPGNDASHWAAAAPSPSASYAGGVLPVITVQPGPVSQVLPAGSSLTYHVEATGTEPLSYQWLLNGSPITGATTDSLVFDFALPINSGRYSVVVMNSAGSAVSVPASLQVTTPPRILAQPQSVTVSPGATVTFSVTATGSGPLSFFWRHDNVLISDATGPSLMLTNVQGDDDGTYTVTVMDTNGIVVSDPARLTVLLRPEVVVPPFSQQAVVGSTVTFSIVSSGTLPMGYRWRRGSFTVKNEVLNSHVSFLTLTNVQTNNAGLYTVVLTNQAFYAPGVLSPTATLTVLQDGDGDGMPDSWETDNGLNPADPTDALLDRDGDTLTNAQEYLAGTDPNDATSFLRVESIAADFEVTGSVQVTFPAMASRSYSVLFKDVLEPAPWSKLVDVAPAPTNRSVEVIDQPSVSTTKRFYRLVTPRVDIP